MIGVALRRVLEGNIAGSGLSHVGRSGLDVCVRTLHMTSELDVIFGAPGPRQELVETVDRISLDHALEHVLQIGIGLHAVEFAGLDQRTQHGPAPAPAVAARKEMILPSESDRSNRALDGIGVEFDAAVIQKARQSVPTGKRVADRFGELAAPRYTGQLRLEPIVQGLDDRPRKRPPFGEATRGRLTAHARLYGVEFAHPAQRLDGDRRVRGLRHVIELASRMAPACGENDVPFLRQRLEAGIAVDMQHALEAFEMRGRTFRLAVGREQEDRRWWLGSGPRPLFARIMRWTVPAPGGTIAGEQE